MEEMIWIFVKILSQCKEEGGGGISIIGRDKLIALKNLIQEKSLEF